MWQAEETLHDQLEEQKEKIYDEFRKEMETIKEKHENEIRLAEIKFLVVVVGSTLDHGDHTFIDLYFREMPHRLIKHLVNRFRKHLHTKHLHTALVSSFNLVPTCSINSC